MKKTYLIPTTEHTMALISDVLGDLNVNSTSAYNGEFDAPRRSMVPGYDIKVL